METATSTSGTNGTDEAKERERKEEEQSKIKFKRKSKLKSYRQGWEQSFLRRSAISVAILKATHTGGTKAYRCGHVHSRVKTADNGDVLQVSFDKFGWTSREKSNNDGKYYYQ
ncbi:PREDICTED: uncharacterized protein LOC101299806 [Fragaria vesca subsp. vesca]|uniref:uncharacterized protein LOC101299806 n=1 Tax=Fragaria vesca subsp. vesca TaxID=101020 RepID=UPI0002C35C19|nr:PREDICTED: uncharacterized protein LOC101299806 [Fragaria vesca subsp. vesca]